MNYLPEADRNSLLLGALSLVTVMPERSFTQRNSQHFYYDGNKDSDRSIRVIVFEGQCGTTMSIQVRDGYRELVSQDINTADDIEFVKQYAKRLRIL